MTTTVEDGCSDTRLTNVASMATSTAAAPTAELTLLIDGYLAGAIIGKGGIERVPAQRPAWRAKDVIMALAPRAADSYPAHGNTRSH